MIQLINTNNFKSLYLDLYSKKPMQKINIFIDIDSIFFFFLFRRKRLDVNYNNIQ